jgi:hypothetical protein
VSRDLEHPRPGADAQSTVGLGDFGQSLDRRQRDDVLDRAVRFLDLDEDICPAREQQPAGTSLAEDRGRLGHRGRPVVVEAAQVGPFPLR